ncbi:MAG: CapA family protein [Thermoleophilia bacterium]|nr:CapA family protein [Thermoleophilia bacterium]
MAQTVITPGKERPSERWWTVAAVVLWAMAIVLAAVYFFGSEGTDATAMETTSSAAKAAEDGFPSASSLGPTTAAPTTTTTTEAPATTTTTSEAPTTTTITLPPPLTVAASGDVLGERGPGYFMDKHGGAAVFEKVKPLLEPAALSFVNVEGPISTTGTRASWKEYTFRGRPALADGLASAGIDVISLANNHSMDYGAKALLDTFVRLNDVGVQWAGAGANSAEAAEPAMLITPAGIVAVLAFTDIIPGGFAAGSQSPGVNVTTPDRKKILSAVEAANKKADFVIVSFHWGEEYTGQAARAERKLAHQVVDVGADLVLGHHPHVLQGLELYRNRLIAYSLGDFVWDHYRPVTGETVILQITMQRAGPPSFVAIPIYLDEVTGVPYPVTGDHAASILGRLAQYSSDLGLQLTIEGDRATFAP